MEKGRGFRVWWLPTMIVGLLVGLTVLATLTSVSATKVPLKTPRAPSPPPPEPSQNAADQPVHPQGGTGGTGSGTGPPDWLLYAGTALAVLLVAGVVFWVLRSLLKDSSSFRAMVRRHAARPAPAVPPEQRAAEVRAAVQAGIAALDDGSADPRRAVIACWLRLEATAAEAGTARAAEDTPADLVGRLLGEQAVSGEALTELADLYRWARYAPHAVDEHMRLRARAALVHVNAELAAVAVG